MGKHEYYSPKAIGNRLKKKGIGKQKWYCQICRKQCRDDNGFKCHTESPAHLNQMAKFAENAEEYLEKFSTEFKNTFLQMLSSRYKHYVIHLRYGTQKVKATVVYQDLVNDRVKLLLNATKWNTLTDFVKFLGRENFCLVEESERGFYITWIDNSLQTINRKTEEQRIAKMKQIDEEREAKMLQRQVENANKLKRQNGNENSTTKQDPTHVLNDTQTKKFKLNLSVNKNSKEESKPRKNLFKALMHKKSNLNNNV